MLSSFVKTEKGRPRLYIEGKQVTAMAYTTYFEERSGYRDFIDAGYRIFFVNVSFTTAPINSQTAFSPFRVGVFENPDCPDYSEFEDAVHKILTACPEAVIFPRVNISMPKWWADTHPEDVICTADGMYREILFSEAFRADGAKLLIQLIDHVKSSDYANRVGGWMFCGGNTQEWIYPSFAGNLTQNAEKVFKAWAKDTHGVEAELPRIEDYTYTGKPELTSQNAKMYATFCNLAMAQTIRRFAKVVKEQTDRRQVVGTFYGYLYEARTPLFGSYGLRMLLDCEDLDYISSPNSYANARSFGVDWADMMPVDSLKYHGKLPFIECDIRTYLTVGVQQARPGEYPDDIYTTNGVSVWVGPPTAELSRKALEKCFAHQITKGSAVWWFDMWGGWYDDPLLMDTMAQTKRIYDESENSAPYLRPQVVFFADEQSYANMPSYSPQIKSIEPTRRALGNCGVPFDCCIVEDAQAVLKNYKAAVFPFPLPSEAGKKAIALCQELQIPYLQATTDGSISTKAFREFFENCDVHCYTEKDDVVYIGNGYVGLHSATAGEKKISLPQPMQVTCLYGTDFAPQITDTLRFSLEENATALFASI